MSEKYIPLLLRNIINVSPKEFLDFDLRDLFDFGESLASALEIEFVLFIREDSTLSSLGFKWIVEGIIFLNN